MIHGEYSVFTNEQNYIEVIIIKRIKVNDIFSNGYSELLQKLGVKEYIEYYSRGGKQKEKIKRLLSQYMEIEERPDIKRYAIQVTDIYDEPVADYDGRGKTRSGYYTKRACPIVSKYLINQKIKDTYSVSQLSKECGFINDRYITYNKDQKTAEERLIKQDPRYTPFMISNCIGYIRPELSTRIYSILNCLQCEYRAIEYEEVFDMVFLNNINRISTPEERTKIRKAENTVIKQMGFKKMFDVYRKRCVKKFYKNVVEYLNNTYQWGIKNYYQKIMINILDYDTLNDLIVDDDIANQYKIEIRERFKQRIINKAMNDYSRNQAKFEADKKALLKNQYLKELFELNFYSDLDIKEILRKHGNFYYYEDYRDIQNGLIDRFIDSLLS